MAFGNQGHPVCRGAESVEFLESKGDQLVAVFRAALAHEVALL